MVMRAYIQIMQSYNNLVYSRGRHWPTNSSPAVPPIVTKNGLTESCEKVFSFVWMQLRFINMRSYLQPSDHCLSDRVEEIRSHIGEDFGEERLFENSATKQPYYGPQMKDRGGSRM